MSFLHSCNFVFLHICDVSFSTAMGMPSPLLQGGRESRNGGIPKRSCWGHPMEMLGGKPWLSKGTFSKLERKCDEPLLNHWNEIRIPRAKGDVGLQDLSSRRRWVASPDP